MIGSDAVPELVGVVEFVGSLVAHEPFDEDVAELDLLAGGVVEPGSAAGCMGGYGSTVGCVAGLGS